MKLRSVIQGACLVGMGYLLGISGLRSEFGLRAADQDAGPTKESVEKIRAAHKALTEAMDSLKQEGRYESATEGVNAFLILAGGGSAKKDLENGQGVDPETFAALYAGQALPEIKVELDKDDQQRLTYKGQLVRLYSKLRLQTTYAERIKNSEVTK